MIAAAAAGDRAAVQALLNAEAVSTNGSTALMEAASAGHTEIVHLLLEAGVTPAMQDGTNGTTPLIAASGCNAVEVLRQLMSAGVSLHAEDGRGMTALHTACRAGALEACHELLRLGSRADAIDHDGLLPIDHCDPSAPRYGELCDALQAARRLHDALQSASSVAGNSGVAASPLTSMALNAGTYFDGGAWPSIGGPRAAEDDDDEWDDHSFKSYDSQQDDRPWH